MYSFIYLYIQALVSTRGWGRLAAQRRGPTAVPWKIIILKTHIYIYIYIYIYIHIFRAAAGARLSPFWWCPLSFKVPRREGGSV